jgi:hypothetical protein
MTAEEARALLQAEGTREPADATPRKRILQ